MHVKDMALPELVAYVQSALFAGGISTVLSGGSCVTLWGPDIYRSDDIDLIVEGIVSRSAIRKIMGGIGFPEHHRYFVHPDAELWVEFPSGPLGVGEEQPREIVSIETCTGTIRALSPTDCVKDRLTWWFYDQDYQCLEQAVGVTKAVDVDLEEIERWARVEKSEQAYAEFCRRVHSV